MAARLDERRALVAVAASPTGKVLVVAGAAGVRPSRVAAADVVGTLVHLAVVYASGGPLVRAFDLSPRATAILGMGALLLAGVGPALGARATAPRVPALVLGAESSKATVAT